MSKVAIQEMLSELESLPDSEQELVLGFLRALKRKPGAAPAPLVRRGHNPALKLVDGLLVFVGELEYPQTDWVKVVRDERDDTLVRQALNLTQGR